MKKIFLIDVKKGSVSHLFKKFKIKFTDCINDADMVLANVKYHKDYNFEISQETTILIAKAQSLNLPIVTYNMTMVKAKKRIEKSPLVFENGFHVCKDTMKFTDSKYQNCGDFLYENAYGNGMIFLNYLIMNIYDDNAEYALEALVNFYRAQNHKKAILHNFKSVHDINLYIESTYPNKQFYSPRIISFEKVDEPKIAIKNGTYLIGDDVFFIGVHKTNTYKNDLFNRRMDAARKYKIVSALPFETKDNYPMKDLILNNNSLAKQSLFFQANLFSMPLEDSAVDTGSLYEIALNVFSGGKGIVHVDSKMVKNKFLNNWLKNKSNIKVVIEKSEEEIFKELNDFI